MNVLLVTASDNYMNFGEYCYLTDICWHNIVGKQRVMEGQTLVYHLHACLLHTISFFYIATELYGLVNNNKPQIKECICINTIMFYITNWKHSPPNPNGAVSFWTWLAVSSPEIHSLGTFLNSGLSFEE